MLRLVIVMCVMSLLSGCEGLMQRQYQYHPPSTPTERHCVAKCAGAKRSCEKICRLKGTTCHCVISYNTCYRACGGEVLG